MKIQLRERIIIGLVIVAALYWLYDTWAARPTMPPEQPAADFSEDNVVVAALEEEMGRGVFDPPPAFREIATAAAWPWAEAAFVSGEALPALRRLGEKKGAPAAPVTPEILVYSGFIQVGERPVAIINGMDYQVGDTVNGLLVERILPQAVLLRHEGGSLEIPLEEAR